MALEKLIPISDVSASTSLSRVSIWRAVRKGIFPAPVKVTERRVAWPESSVQAWIQSRCQGVV